MTRAKAAGAEDPVLEHFLGFLAQGIARHPGHIQAVDTAFYQRLQSLVGDIEVDLDSALSADDE